MFRHLFTDEEANPKLLVGVTNVLKEKFHVSGNRFISFLIVKKMTR